MQLRINPLENQFKLKHENMLKIDTKKTTVMIAEMTMMFFLGRVGKMKVRSMIVWMIVQQICRRTEFFDGFELILLYTVTISLYHYMTI